ncbi:alpha/beta hydrolase, partial [Staphylococcus aureus]
SASYRHFGARLARAAGVRVLLLDYRLTPEHPFPAALEDSAEAIDWLVEQGVGPAHIAVGGDSCGGNLALSALQRRWVAGQALPAALWLISP